MDYGKNYIKVPVSISSYRIKAYNVMNIPFERFIFIHINMGHYLIKEDCGRLIGVSINSRAYDGPKGWVKIYVNKDELCRTIKATKLSKKMYPDAIEKDGNLIILKKGFELG